MSYEYQSISAGQIGPSLGPYLRSSDPLPELRPRLRRVAKWFDQRGEGNTLVPLERALGPLLYGMVDGEDRIRRLALVEPILVEWENKMVEQKALAKRGVPKGWADAWIG